MSGVVVSLEWISQSEWLLKRKRRVRFEASRKRWVINQFATLLDIYIYPLCALCVYIYQRKEWERERERERNNILYKGKNEIVKGKFLLYLLDFHGWEKKRDSVVRCVLSVLLMSTAAVDCEKSILWLSFSFLFFPPSPIPSYYVYRRIALSIFSIG